FAGLALTIGSRRAKNFQMAMINFRERARPRIECTDFSFDCFGGLAPIDPAMFALELGRVSGELVFLWKARGLFFVEQQDRLSQRFVCNLGQLVVQGAAGLIRRERNFSLKQDVTGIEPFIHIHDRDSGFAIARRDRGLDWRRTTPTRQERGVQIQASNPWSFEQAARKNLSV